MNNRSALWKTDWERRGEEMGTERKGGRWVGHKKKQEMERKGKRYKEDVKRTESDSEDTWETHGSDREEDRE